MNIEKLARRSDKKINCLICDIEETSEPMAFLSRKFNSEMNVITIVCQECYERKKSNWKDSGWKLEEPEEEE